MKNLTKLLNIKSLEKVVIKHPSLAWKFHLNILSSNIDSKYFTGSIIDKYGSKYWYKKGELHRKDGPAIEYIDGHKSWFKEGELHRLDGPAMESSNGSKYWFKEGKYHRLDGPAIEFSDGDKVWYKEGNKHRIDGPAIERSNGDKIWYIEDKKYTEEEFNKLAWKFHLNILSSNIDSEYFIGSIMDKYGSKEWYKEGKLHRDNGPALEYSNGTKEWWKEEKRHRLDGPAIEYSDGSKDWYIEGVKYTESEFKRKKICLGL